MSHSSRFQVPAPGLRIEESVTLSSFRSPSPGFAVVSDAEESLRYSRATCRAPPPPRSDEPRFLKHVLPERAPAPAPRRPRQRPRIRFGADGDYSAHTLSPIVKYSTLRRMPSYPSDTEWSAGSRSRAISRTRTPSSSSEVVSPLMAQLMNDSFARFKRSREQMPVTGTRRIRAHTVQDTSSSATHQFASYKTTTVSPLSPTSSTRKVPLAPRRKAAVPRTTSGRRAFTVADIRSARGRLRGALVQEPVAEVRRTHDSRRALVAKREHVTVDSMSSVCSSSSEELSVPPPLVGAGTDMRALRSLASGCSLVSARSPSKSHSEVQHRMLDLGVADDIMSEPFWVSSLMAASVSSALSAEEEEEEEGDGHRSGSGAVHKSGAEYCSEESGVELSESRVEVDYGECESKEESQQTRHKRRSTATLLEGSIALFSESGPLRVERSATPVDSARVLGIGTGLRTMVEPPMVDAMGNHTYVDDLELELRTASPPQLLMTAATAAQSSSGSDMQQRASFKEHRFTIDSETDVTSRLRTPMLKLVHGSDKDLYQDEVESSSSKHSFGAKVPLKAGGRSTDETLGDCFLYGGELLEDCEEDVGSDSDVAIEYEADFVATDSSTAAASRHLAPAVRGADSGFEATDRMRADTSPLAAQLVNDSFARFKRERTQRLATAGKRKASAGILGSTREVTKLKDPRLDAAKTARKKRFKDKFKKRFSRQKSRT